MLPKLLLLLIAVLGAHAADPKPLLRAHAHNDYEHPRPLLDALDQGFCSVEADIHLVQGALLVAHDPEHVRPERTLENLYLEPLRRRAAENGGRIYRGGPPLILLIDIKTEAESTYAVLRTVLRRHESILTRFADGKICTNAVTVILSGNRPRATLLAEADRLAAFDGRIADLGQGLPAAFMPLVSDNFRSHFSWAGEGEMSPEELKKLRGLVDRAHREGRMVRFWAAPDTLNGWHLMRAAKVDLINTDHLAGLAAYLRQE